MANRRWIVSVVCGWLVVGAAGLRADEGAPPYPLPNVEDVHGYLTEAAAYVNENPQSRYTPGVILDMIATMTAAGPDGGNGNIKLYKYVLLSQYSNTMEARYILRTFANAKAYRDFLVDMPPELDRHVLRHAQTLGPAIWVGGQRFGEAFLRDPAIMMRMGLALDLQHAPPEHRESLIADLLSRPDVDEADRQVARLVFESDKSPAERIAALHEIDPDHDNDQAKFFKRYYLTHLDAAQRSDPAIRWIVIEDLLRRHEWGEALGPIEQARREAADDDRPAVLAGWARLALGDRARAREALEPFAGRADGWAGLGAELLAAADRADEAVDRHHRVVVTLIDRLQAGIERVQADLFFRTEQGDEVRVYLAADRATSHYEALMHKNDEMLFGYLVSAEQTRAYGKSPGMAGALYAAPGDGPLPAPYLQLDRAADGRFSANFNFGVYGSAEQALQSGASILDSPFLTRRSGFATMVQSIVRRGWIPAAPADEGGRTRLEWLQPRVHEPAPKRVSITLDGDGMVRRITADDHLRAEFEYGDADDFDLSPPQWPEAPEIQITHEQLRGTVVSQLLTAAFQLAQE